jgi:3-isopropylmalate/(R)-2-methylmalate dehydratase small subunit
MSGTVWKFGSNIDTDIIIPGQYLNISNPEELAQHCMEGSNKEFNRQVKPGDMILAGENFGCGSSREHAPMAIKALGISCVIAKSIARIFFRNAINIGLPVIECKEAYEEIMEGDVLEIDYASGVIKNLTNSKELHLIPFPPFIQEIITCGGLAPYTARRIQSKK